jgi:psp operon transcriptional activator
LLAVPAIQREELSQANTRIEALGQSEAFVEFQRDISRAARINRPVLLIGERGTGKELAASRLHTLSPRWEGPFVAVNCAALAPTLIESELFGHEEGAFTGANKKKVGRFEMAHGGTLFLDEIGNIPIETQEKILRVVEYASFERVGGMRPIQVDVRLVGATNVNLLKLAEEGRFKQDLLDRLSFEVLFLPPLRQRREDILLLANYFATRIAYELGIEEVPAFSEEAEQALVEYPWYGNIRELKNVVERAVYRTQTPLIDKVIFNPFELPDWWKTEADSKATTTQEVQQEESLAHLPSLGDQSFTEAVETFEVAIMRMALEKVQYNQRKAAELLKMSYHQFRWYYRKYRQRLENTESPL